jgi:hypothetical protein
VQDQAILHEELKCFRGILKMSLFHCSYFIKQLPNGFPSRIAWSVHLGCCSTFGKRKNTLACGSSIFTLSESLATSLVWITQSCTENHSYSFNISDGGKAPADDIWTTFPLYRISFRSEVEKTTYPYLLGTLFSEELILQGEMLFRSASENCTFRIG